MTAADGRQARNGISAALTWPLTVMIVAMLFIGLQAFRKPLAQPESDEFYYLTIARDMLLHGVVTNGPYKRGPFFEGALPEHFGDEDPQWARPGRFFAPAYPVIEFFVAKADAGFDAALRCHVKNAQLPSQPSCPMRFEPLVMVNVVLWSLALVAIFAMAQLVSGSLVVGWLAFILTLATGEPALYARTYLSENVAIPTFLLFMLFATRGVHNGTAKDFAIAGVALGCAALSRPSYAYLIYLLAPLMIATAFLRSDRLRLARPSCAMAFLLGAGLVMLPWMLRNYVQFGDFAVSRGYAEVILIQRVSYNRMSFGEWAVSWVYWLPDFGDNVAAALFPPDLYARLDFDNPKGFYLEGGGGSFSKKILLEAGSTAAVMGLLIKKYVLGDAVWHTLVTLPLTLRGMGVGQYLSVAGGLLFWPVAKYLARLNRLRLLLVMSLPAVFMAGLHGFVSVNIARYNLALLGVYATVCAVAIVHGVLRWRARTGRAAGGAE